MHISLNSSNEYTPYEEKNKAFIQHILRECEEQGFTVMQMIGLSYMLRDEIKNLCDTIMTEKTIETKIILPNDQSSGRS